MKDTSKILENGKAVIIPMDHGISEGPIEGLVDMNETVKKIESGGASAVLLHKGIIKNLNERPKCGLIMHLSAGTKYSKDPNRKVLVGSVEEAMRLNADAVSIHVNIGGNDYESEMIEDLGMVSEDCDENGIPLLAMMYARGPNIKDKLDPEAIALVARVGGELGADIVKCPYTGDVDSFKKIVRGCPVPIVIAGGPKCNTEKEVFEMVKGAMDAGAIGISLGRNAFQCKNPTSMVKALRKIIVENGDIETALEIAGV